MFTKTQMKTILLYVCQNKSSIYLFSEIDWLEN